MGLFNFFRKEKGPSEVEKVFEKLHTGLSAVQMVDKAISHRNVGEHDKAICLLKEVLKRYPRYTPAKTVLGVTMLLSGDTEGAEKQFNRILTEHPDGRDFPLVEVYANLGSLYNKYKNDVAAALEYYRLGLSCPKPDRLTDEEYEFIESGVYRDLCVIYFYKLKNLSLAKQYASRRLAVVKDCSAAKKVYAFCRLAEGGEG